jgi:hypothetical protein
VRLSVTVSRGRSPSVIGRETVEFELLGVRSVGHGMSFPAWRQEQPDDARPVGSRGSSSSSPGNPPGPEAGADAMADRACREQRKSSTGPGVGEDQHAGNTDKAALPGTRRHDCQSL